MEYVCPFCGSDNFETPDWDLFGGTLETYCECKNCGGSFTGKFDIALKRITPNERKEGSEN